MIGEGGLPESGWESKEAEEEDRRKAVKEKRRAVELCLAFAVAVKHCEYAIMLLWSLTYGLAGQIFEVKKACKCIRILSTVVRVQHMTDWTMLRYYEDLYELVRFLPAYNLPSGIPPPAHAYNDQNQSIEQLQSRSSSPFFRGRRERVADAPTTKTPSPASTLNKLAYENKPTKSAIGLAGVHSVLVASVASSSPHTLLYDQPFSQPRLRPARCPPKHHWSEAMPIRYLPFAKSKRRERRMKQAIYADCVATGQKELDSIDGRPLARNVPREITLYMVRKSSLTDI